MIVVSALAPAALGAPELGSPEELEAAEQLARGLIDRCKKEPVACDATPEALGQAFVVRALAAAVLKGELDVRGVANARLLAPEVVEAWSELLPAAGQATPEAWVVALLAPPAPPPPPASAPPRSTPAAVIRASGHTFEVEAGWGLGGVLEARGEPVQGLGVLGRASVREMGLPPVALRGFVFSSIHVREGGLELAAGPRWKGRGGAELLPHVGATAYSGGVTGRSARELDDAGILPDPAIVGFGGLVGVLGVYPLWPGGPLLATGAMSATMGYSQNLARPLDSSREIPDSVAGQQHPVDVWLRSEPGIEWRPGNGALLGLSAPLELTLSVGDPRSTLTGGFVATVGWTL